MLVMDPEFLHQRVLSAPSQSTAPVSADDAKARKARLKDLATQERTLLGALRAAASAAQGITRELEAVARERKEIERTFGSFAASSSG